MRAAAASTTLCACCGRSGALLDIARTRCDTVVGNRTNPPHVSRYLARHAVEEVAQLRRGVAQLVLNTGVEIELIIWRSWRGGRCRSRGRSGCSSRRRSRSALYGVPVKKVSGVWALYEDLDHRHDNKPGAEGDRGTDNSCGNRLSTLGTLTCVIAGNHNEEPTIENGKRYKRKN